MAKGKTNQPLTFMVHPSLYDTQFMRDLEAKGHIVHPSLSMEDVDIVFGPNCHMLTEDMMNQKGMVDVALRAARKRKRAK